MYRLSCHITHSTLMSSDVQLELSHHSRYFEVLISSRDSLLLCDITYCVTLIVSRPDQFDLYIRHQSLKHVIFFLFRMHFTDIYRWSAMLYPALGTLLTLFVALGVSFVRGALTYSYLSINNHDLLTFSLPYMTEISVVIRQ